MNNKFEKLFDQIKTTNLKILFTNSSQFSINIFNRSLMCVETERKMILQSIKHLSCEEFFILRQIM